MERKSKRIKFTEKRNPYKKYNYAKWDWIDIFLEIETTKDSDNKVFKPFQKNITSITIH